MVLARLPADLFNHTLTFVVSLSAIRIVSRRWLHAVGGEYKRRALKLEPLLAESLALGLLVPSWYRLFQALAAPRRGVQAGRRMKMRYVMDYWDSDDETELNEFTLLIRLVDSTGRDQRLVTAWTNTTDGPWWRIALPWTPVVADLRGPSEVRETDTDEFCRRAQTAGLWNILMNRDDVELPSQLEVEVALHHRRLGYARLGSWEMHGTEVRTINGAESGQLLNDDEARSAHWWRSNAICDAIANGETLRFRMWAMEDKFGDNMDVQSVTTVVEAQSCANNQNLELEMVARWREQTSSWQVEVQAVNWELRLDRDASLSDEQHRQRIDKLKEENVSQAAVLATQLSWLPD